MIQPQSGSQMDLDGIDPLKNRQFKVRKRSGEIVDFDETRIFNAISEAFKADLQQEIEKPLNGQFHLKIRNLTDTVVQHVITKNIRGEELNVEGIQDEVETQLMKEGHFSVARRYIVYREEHRKARIFRDKKDATSENDLVIHIKNPKTGTIEDLEASKIRNEVASCCANLEEQCSAETICEELFKSVYDGITIEEINNALILSAKAHIEKEPGYTYVAARLLLKTLYKEVLDCSYKRRRNR